MHRTQMSNIKISYRVILLFCGRPCFGKFCIFWRKLMDKKLEKLNGRDSSKEADKKLATDHTKH